MPNRRILILDDDVAVGHTLQWMAKSLGFEAEFVTSSDEFFRLLDGTHPDIISIDLVMPDLDGVEIMRLLAERKSRARIIISSGMGTRVLDAAERSASEHGLDIVGVIPKPISRDALRALIGEATDQEAETAQKEGIKSSDSIKISRQDLWGALDRHEFEAAYQPKITCRTGAPAGFEAMVRWRHPVHGLLPPETFIPATEEFGLIDVLTAQVFDQSLEWLSHAFPNSALKMSLNLSAKSLVDIQLADHLAALCKQFSVAPERIVLELTESSAMVDPTLSLDLMTRFRVKGFQLSIDDFGTGYSSMIQLVRLPFSEIKVDKSFVLKAHESKESRTIIKSIVDLGHSLGMDVTAEGVDHLDTLNFLNRVGCDLAQGYLIARPMPGDSARNWAVQRTSPQS
jgi:EAL domain-containing protein (putative c-di-GMP-specific phosphodiesterase class I)/FixJ family two-component response regulator